MKKNLIALAVAGAFVPAVALAQASSVTIYGTFNADFQSVEAKGATTGAAADVSSRTAVSSNSSNIGFKGVEDLGGGLKAIFQVESSVGVDDSAGSTFGGRNTNVGLTGNFGTVFLGQWDTPYKVLTTKIDPFYATTIASNNSIVGSPGFNVRSGTVAGPAATAATGDASFDRRQRNSLQYWTPNFQGFSAKALFAQGESKDFVAGASPRIWGVNLVYEAGPLYVGYAFERHDDFFGIRVIDAAAAFGGTLASSVAGHGAEDKAHKVAAQYTFGGFTVGGWFERMEFERNGAATAGFNLAKYETDTFGVHGKFTTGAHIIRASYARNDADSCSLATGAACSIGGLDARMWAAGYGYTLSKRTEAFASYVKISNDAGQNNQFGTNTNGVTAAAGADPEGFGIGLRHIF